MTIEEIKKRDSYRLMLEAIEYHDPEGVHSYFDGLIRAIAAEHSPEVVLHLEELVKEVKFWYA